jgi:subtilisin family serine protease
VGVIPSSALLVCCALLAGPPARAGGVGRAAPAPRPDHVLAQIEAELRDLPHDRASINVAFAPGVSSRSPELSPLLRGVGARVKHTYRLIDGFACLEIDGDVAQTLATLRARPDLFADARPNALVFSTSLPNDPEFPLQYSLRNTGQQIGVQVGVPGADIGAAAAWNVTTGDPNLVIAVLDTGLARAHPDLEANVFINAPEASGVPGVDDDQNGYVDDIRGWNFRSDNPASWAGDTTHGTHVAGIIAARGNNASGISGVLWNARILPIKFMEGTGTMAGATRSLEYALLMGARISNNSWGTNLVTDPAFEAMIAQAGRRGHLFVAAAGNFARPAPGYPASSPSPAVLAVAATDFQDRLATLSNFSPTRVHLAAPGVAVLSCAPDGSTLMMTGTSMAAPHVAGVAGLIWSWRPDWTLAQVRQRLMDTVRPVPALADKTISAGVLSAARAVTMPVTPDAALAPAPDEVVPGSSLAVDLRVNPARDALAGPAVLRWRAGTTGPFAETAMTRARDGSFAAALPVTACSDAIQYYVTGTGVDGGQLVLPAGAAAAPTVVPVGRTTSTLVDDTMEIRAPDWFTVSGGDNATTGRWEFGRPQPTAAQPGQGRTPGGVNCFFTGLSAGTATDSNDVGGPSTARTSLISPAYNLAGRTGVRISLWRWFSAGAGDSLTVSITTNNGQTWTTVERLTASTGGWARLVFDPARYVPTLTSQVRLRFVAEDAPPASVCEAGVDDVRVSITTCVPAAPQTGR